MTIMKLSAKFNLLRRTHNFAHIYLTVKFTGLLINIIINKDAIYKIIFNYTKMMGSIFRF